MTKKEAAIIIMQLQNSYPVANITPEFKQNFVDFLIDLNLAHSNKTVQILLRSHKYFPSMAEFYDIYTSLLRNDTSDKLRTECNICNSKGFVGYYNVDNGLKYYHIGYCECENGKQWQISTDKRRVRNCKEISPLEWLAAQGEDDIDCSIPELIFQIKNFISSMVKLSKN
jgi:hypothetical protein